MESEKKIAYLQMIQEPINRMSTISSVLKGFSATTVATFMTVSYEKVSLWLILVSFLPIIAFAALDIYYLKLERKFRFLFEEVRLGNHDIDFSLRLTTDSIDIIRAGARTRDCILSPSIYLFYFFLMAFLGGIFILKLYSI